MTINWTTGVEAFIPYHLQNGVTNALEDLSGNIADATISGAVINGDDTAYVFDGINDYSTFADTTWETVSWWMKADVLEASVRPLNRDDNASRDSYWATFGTGGEFNIAIHESDATWTQKAPTTGLYSTSWVQVIVVHDSDNMRMYINGSLTDTWGGAITLANKANLWDVGARVSDGIGYFDGEICNVVIFNTPLTSTEASDFHSEGRNYNPYATEEIPNNAVFMGCAF